MTSLWKTGRLSGEPGGLCLLRLARRPRGAQGAHLGPSGLQGLSSHCGPTPPPAGSCGTCVQTSRGQHETQRSGKSWQQDASRGTTVPSVSQAGVKDGLDISATPALLHKKEEEDKICAIGGGASGNVPGVHSPQMVLLEDMGHELGLDTEHTCTGHVNTHFRAQ